MRVERRDEVEAFTTLDGSIVRELAPPGRPGSPHQSLAEAVVAPGGETEEHFHPRAEEIYYFTAGSGRMRLGDEEADVRAGDCVAIESCTPHKLWNTGTEPLVLLCASAPPYSDDDTMLTGG
jgi:mannose-6-phosphate isomerase-like protein (cupin superfamily)